MTRDAIKSLPDAELLDVGVWVLEEVTERKARRKQEAITRIKAIAAQEGLDVFLKGTRRPRKRKQDVKPGNGIKEG